MKVIILISVFLISSAFAETKNTEDVSVGAPSNPVSQGSDPSAGINESPTGTTERQEEIYEDRPASMGGAPNMGGGMGTGTGAGSTVGPELEDGNITAGAVSGEEDE